MSVSVTQESKDALLSYLTTMVEASTFSKSKYYKGQIDLAYSLNIITQDELKNLKKQLTNRFK